AHGRAVHFDEDGSGTAQWRIYRFCSESPPPCDTFIGNEIILGGHASLLLTAGTGATATAVVSQSSDPDSLPDGPIGLHTLPGYEFEFDNGFGPFCRPYLSQPGACGA